MVILLGLSVILVAMLPLIRVDRLPLDDSVLVLLHEFVLQVQSILRC